MPSLKVIAHHEQSAGAELAGAWERLHTESGSANPFSGPDWSVSWWDHFGTPRDDPYLLEIRNEDQLVGVAAFRRQRLPGGVIRLTPVGSGPPWIGPFETPAMLAAPRFARDVGRAVVSHLCSPGRAWDWAQIALDARAGWLEPEWVPDPAFTVVPRKTTASVVFDLTPPEDALLAGRRNLRESLRRARNRLDRDFGAADWSVRAIRREPELTPAVERLMRLHHDRSELTVGSHLHSDVLADVRVRSYLAEVLRTLAGRDHVGVYELVAGGDVIASQLVLETATTAYSSVSGMERRAWEYSAVTHLQWRAALDSKRAGRSRFNLSVSPNQAKRRWSDALDYHPEFSLIAPGRRSRAAFAAASIGTALISFSETRRQALEAWAARRS